MGASEGHDSGSQDWLPEENGQLSNPVQRRLSPTEIDNMIVELYAEGSSIDPLARRYGVHRNTIIKHLDERRVKRRRVVRKMTDSTVGQAATRYRRVPGESLKVVASRSGVDRENPRPRVQAGRHSGATSARVVDGPVILCRDVLSGASRTTLSLTSAESVSRARLPSGPHGVGEERTAMGSSSAVMPVTQAGLAGRTDGASSKQPHRDERTRPMQRCLT